MRRIFSIPCTRPTGEADRGDEGQALGRPRGPLQELPGRMNASDRNGRPSVEGMEPPEVPAPRPSRSTVMMFAVFGPRGGGPIAVLRKRAAHHDGAAQPLFAGLLRRLKNARAAPIRSRMLLSSSGSPTNHHPNDKRRSKGSSTRPAISRRMTATNEFRPASTPPIGPRTPPERMSDMVI